MSTQKRRVIYVSDEEWAKWREEATAADQTVSDWVRQHIVGRINHRNVVRINGQVVSEDVTVMNPADRFNTRPFTPVPKK